jgi:hypothetical protein
LKRLVIRQSRGFRPVAEELQSPFTRQCPLPSGNGDSRLDWNAAHQLIAEKLLGEADRLVNNGPPRPFLCGTTSNDADIGARFTGQIAAASQPFLNSPGSRVIRSGCQAEIAKLLAQFPEPSRRLLQRLLRLKGVSQSAPTRRARHELCDALGPLVAYGRGIEIALLSNQSDKKIQRYVVSGCRVRECLAIWSRFPCLWVGKVWGRGRVLRSVSTSLRTGGPFERTAGFSRVQEPSSCAGATLEVKQMQIAMQLSNLCKGSVLQFSRRIDFSITKSWPPD